MSRKEGTSKVWNAEWLNETAGYQQQGRAKEEKKADNKPPSDLLPPFSGCLGSLRFLFGAGEVTAIGGLCDFHGQLLRRRQRQAPLAGENQSAWQTSPVLPVWQGGARRKHISITARMEARTDTHMLEFWKSKKDLRFIERSRTPNPLFLHSAWMCIINVIISYT